MRLLSVLLIAAAVGCNRAPADTVDNRRAAAERYLEAVPMKPMVRDMAVQIAGAMPEPERSAFIRAMTESTQIDVLENAAEQAMIRHFTAGEIEALADFYGSEEGRSVMQKMPLYMADVMPAIQQELMRTAGQLDPSSGFD